MRHPCVLVAVGMGALLAGCEVVTGSTAGYTLQEAGPACSSRANCDAGEVCCDGLTVNASGSLGSGPLCRFQTCSLLPGVSFPQLCEQSSECPDGSACTRQACSGGPSDASFLACGLLFGCQAQ
jgi:hypothetical protein